MEHVVFHVTYHIIGTKPILPVKHAQLAWYIVFKLIVAQYVQKVHLSKKRENVILVQIIHIIQIKLILVLAAGVTLNTMR
jgi:hypothetical protein